MKKVFFKLAVEEEMVASHNLQDIKKTIGFVGGKTEDVNDCAILTKKVISMETNERGIIVFNYHYATEAEKIKIKIEKKYKCRECGIEIDEKGICEQCIEEKQLDATDKVDIAEAEEVEEGEEEENNEEIEVLE